MIRSTKAGIETPATPPPPACLDPTREPLNEGRDRDPGDTPKPSHDCRGTGPLNEGRDRDPGDTSGSLGSPWAISAAQRRPGSRPRRHLRRRDPTPTRVSTLNEGRDRDPGDTRDGRRRDRGVPNRSTKAGDRDPGDTRKTMTSPIFLQSAQRRPGSRPRRHTVRCHRWLKREIRSTKAGIETPATLGCSVRAREAGVQRSTKAGIETPATRERFSAICPSGRPLNEGRDRDPGDTRPLAEGTGAPKHAQRRPGSRPRRHLTRRRSSSTLNEGRDRDPGDTLHGDGVRSRRHPQIAQRRPGSRPRRHP